MHSESLLKLSAIIIGIAAVTLTAGCQRTEEERLQERLDDIDRKRQELKAEMYRTDRALSDVDSAIDGFSAIKHAIPKRQTVRFATALGFTIGRWRSNVAQIGGSIRPAADILKLCAFGGLDKVSIGKPNQGLLQQIEFEGQIGKARGH